MLSRSSSINKTEDTSFEGREMYSVFACTYIKLLLSLIVTVSTEGKLVAWSLLKIGPLQARHTSLGTLTLAPRILLMPMLPNAMTCMPPMKWSEWQMLYIYVLASCMLKQMLRLVECMPKLIPPVRQKWCLALIMQANSPTMLWHLPHRDSLVLALQPLRLLVSTARSLRCVRGYA